jgi:hypothetical protein
MGLVRQLVVTIAALAALGACGEGGSEGGGAWEFKVDSSRAGAPVAWLRSVGKEGPRNESPAISAILSLDCRPDHTGAAILTEQVLRQGSVEVELRLDGGEPRKVEGFAGTTPTGGQVVLTPPLDSILDLLTGHGQAAIEYEDGAGSAKTSAMFPVAGLETYSERFLAACGPRGGAK